MWSVATVCLLLSICTVFGRNEFIDLGKVVDDRTVPANYSRNDTTEIPNQMKVGRSFWDEIDNWSTLGVEYFSEKLGIAASQQPPENGRKLKYRKAELKFMMKTLFIFKVVLGLILPLSILTSKILSWKAVTLSLMAFMLAKILFVKNLLSGKPILSAGPANFVPPYLIHGGLNDLFWKRHGDTQNAFTWTQT